MAKYSVGDRVRINDKAGLWEMEDDIGLVGKIQEIDAWNDRPGDPWYIIGFDALPAAHFPELALDPV